MSGMWQFLNLVVALAVGVGLIAGAIFFGGALRDVIEAISEGNRGREAILTALGRALQLLFIALASLLPALLYFLFDREQLETLRHHFIRQIFRLDRTVETVTDVKAKYGTLMGEVYGRRAGRLLPGKRWPILVGTIVIALGWVLTLLNPQITVVSDEEGLAALFEPRRTAIAFAFLAAYFFAISSVLRGYVRGDLRPKAYSSITVRILVAFILAWVLELVLADSATLLVLAFLTGVVPETALIRLQEFLRGSLQKGRDVLPALYERHPLTDLEGIDLYDRARLMDEGVTNVQALAHHDLIELLLRTRIAAPRLVDWTDQAILHLHLGPERDSAGDRESARDALRRYGIRTATGTIRATAS